MVGRLVNATLVGAPLVVACAGGYVEPADQCLRGMFDQASVDDAREAIMCDFGPDVLRVVILRYTSEAPTSVPSLDSTGMNEPAEIRAARDRASADWHDRQGETQQSWDGHESVCRKMGGDVVGSGLCVVERAGIPTLNALPAVP